MSKLDRAELAAFRIDPRGLLNDAIVDDRRWLNPDTRQDLAEAWNLSIERRFAVLLEQMDYPAPNSDQALDIELERAGLTGAELQLKTRGFRRALARYSKRPIRNALSQALRWANVILGSMAPIIPHAEAIKEFKDALETALQDVPEVARGIRRRFRRA